jgi:uncharacterized membrane protein HdeD (DUF308 family)
MSSVKKFRWGYLLISLVLCAVGLCFIIYPNNSIKIGSYIIAAAAMLVGIILAIKVLADRKRDFSFATSIFSAVLTVACGVVALIIPNEIFKLYPMLIGLFIILDGSFKLQTVINAKRYKIKCWWLLLLFAVISIIGGFFVIRLRVDIDVSYRFFSIIMGASLCSCGLQNFLSLFYLGRIVSKANDKVDSRVRDISDTVNDDAVIADSYIDDNEIGVEVLPIDNKKAKLPKKRRKELKEGTKLIEGGANEITDNSNDAMVIDDIVINEITSEINDNITDEDNK